LLFVIVWAQFAKDAIETRKERLFSMTIKLNYYCGVCLLPPIQRILEN
jgi:DNA polymerase elongation subunit (family B)